MKLRKVQTQAATTIRSSEVSEHEQFLAGIDIKDDTSLLAYADFIQGSRSEAEAEKIRSVVAHTRPALDGTDERARERALESRRRLIQLGYFRADGERAAARADSKAEKLHALLSRPTPTNRS